MKLTNRSVEDIATGDKDVVLWDSDLPGFGVRVKPSGVRSYVIQFRDGTGRSRRTTLGRHGELDAAEARRKAQERLEEAKSSRKPKPAMQPTGSSGDLSVAALCERYMEEHALPRKTPRSAREDRRLLDNRIIPALGEQPLSEIAEDEVRALHESLAGTPYEGNRTLALLRKMLNLAEDWGLRPDGSNPCRRIKPFEERKRARCLAPEELARLGAALKEADSKYREDLTLVAAVRLLLLTGCRVSELLALRWDDVDWDEGTAALSDAEGEPDGRHLHMGKAALKVLGDMPYVSDFVLPAITDPDEALSVSTLEHAWRRIRTGAGLDKVRLHDLRHTFASLAAANGYGLPLTDRLLGYRGSPAANRYGPPPPERLREAADVIAKEMAALLSPPRKKAATAKKKPAARKGRGRR